MKKLLLLLLIFTLLFSGCKMLLPDEYKKPQELLLNYPTDALPFPDDAFIFSQEEKQGEIIVWYGIKHKDKNETLAFYINYINNNNIMADVEQDYTEYFISCTVDNNDFDIRIQDPTEIQSIVFESVTKAKVTFLKDDNEQINNSSQVQDNIVSTESTAIIADSPLQETAYMYSTPAPTAEPTPTPEPTAEPTPQQTLQTKTENNKNPTATPFNTAGRAMTREAFVDLLTEDTWVYVFSVDGPSEMPELGYKDITPSQNETFIIVFGSTNARIICSDINTKGIIREDEYQFGLDNSRAMMYIETVEVGDGTEYYLYHFCYINQDGYLIHSLKL